MTVTLASCAYSQGETSAQKQCSAEAKQRLYGNYLENSNKGDQATAFEAAKKYVSCPEDARDEEDVLAKLNLDVGRMLLKDLPGEAIPYLIKAVSYKSTIKTTPETYIYLADAYERGPYTQLGDAYRSRFQGKDESDESLLALQNILQIIDRMIDAYARAVALAGVELPKKTEPRSLRTVRDYGKPSDWMDTLIDFYEFRHNRSRDDLKELISTVLSKPIPPEPIPITSLPAKKK